MKTIIGILFAVFSLHSFAQTPIVSVVAKVTNDENKNLNGAIFSTYKDNVLFRTDTTKSNGRVRNIELPTGSKYKIVISKEGYVSKMAEVDANVLDESHSFPEHPLQFQVTLFKECDAGDYTFLKSQPLIKFRFDASGIISFDRDSLRYMMKKVNNAHYANLSSADHKIFSTNYYGGMEQMELQDFDKGLEMLLKAKEIVDCPFVLDKIEECKELKTQAKYDTLVSSGDLLYSQNKFKEALEEYKKANLLIPYEQYPASQMIELEFKLAVLDANAYFEKKDYASALKLYDRALVLKPSDDSFAKKRAKCLQKVKK